MKQYPPAPSPKEFCVNDRRFANEILMHFRNLRKSSHDVFISDPIDTDKEGNSLTLQDIMSDDENIFDCIDLRLKSEQMYKYIDKHLGSREKRIIVMRYGLFCTRPLTQREVADALGISRSYVSRRAYGKWEATDIVISTQIGYNHSGWDRVRLLDLDKRSLE